MKKTKLAISVMLLVAIALQVHDNVLCYKYIGSDESKPSKEKSIDKENKIGKNTNHEWHENLIDNGLSVVFNVMGDAYHYGHIVDQNYKKSAMWYEMAAERGLIEAQINIGAMYYLGKGVTRDYQKSYWWYRMAAEQGYAQAQFVVGMMYQQGSSVKRHEFQKKEMDDYENEIRNLEFSTSSMLNYCNDSSVYEDDTNPNVWNEKKQEFHIASYSIGLIFCNGEDIKNNYPQVAMWHKKHADLVLNHSEKIFDFYSNEWYGEDLDYEKAAKWYLMAANQGFARAQNNLGVMYSKGQGVEKNYKKSLAFIKMAAEQGLALAQFNLGKMLSYGLGGKNHNEQAIMWYEKAATQGLVEAQYEIGIKYQFGISVKRDLDKAKEWFKRAADQNYLNSKEIYEEIHRYQQSK